MRRISKSWRWPLAGAALAGVGALFVPVGGMLWIHLLVALCAVVVLVRLAHREVPFPVALAQLRLGGDDRPFYAPVSCRQRRRGWSRAGPNSRPGG